jgi:hypothetical protein
MTEKNLYYLHSVTINDLASLKRRTTYLINRSVNGRGVGGTWIRNYRNDVQTYLGKKAFQYLELRLDAKDYTWRVSNDFNWTRLERFGMTRSYEKSSAFVKKHIQIPISGDDPDRNVRVTLTQIHKGYYQGDLYILGTSYHVEAIQIDVLLHAVNDNYQNRIDRYIESNEGFVPETVKIGRRVFFVNIEAYAQ